MSVKRIAGRSTAALAIGALVVAAGGIGYAAASSGGVLVLGKHNAATSVTSLSNRKGPALSLSARHGKPALEVNTTSRVLHLNASLLGGKTAAGLETSGSAVASHYTNLQGVNVQATPLRIAETAALRKGTYYVTVTTTAAALADPTFNCAVSMANLSKAKAPMPQSVLDLSTEGTLGETVPVTVSGGQRISEFCWVTGSPTTTAVVVFTGMTAIRVDASRQGVVAPSHVSPL